MPHLIGSARRPSAAAFRGRRLRIFGYQHQPARATTGCGRCLESADRLELPRSHRRTGAAHAILLSLMSLRARREILVEDSLSRLRPRGPPASPIRTVKLDREVFTLVTRQHAAQAILRPVLHSSFQNPPSAFMQRIGADRLPSRARITGCSVEDDVWIPRARHQPL